MAAGTRTGTGGFELDGVTRTFDVGSPDSEPVIVPVDRGDIDVDSTPKDLSKPTRVTLGKYLSETTQGLRDNRSNRFPVTGDPKDVSTKTSQGYPATPSPPSSDQFQPDLDPSTSSDFQSVSRDVKKGASSQSGFDGHDLLRDPGRQVVKRYVSTVLSKNRFSVDNKQFGSTNIGVPPKDYNPDVRISSVPGVYDHGQTKSKNDIPFSKMAQVGPLLLLRAAGELGSGDDVDFRDGAIDLAALLPGSAQLSIAKVSPTALDAKDALDHLVADDGNFRQLSISDSWGTVNHPLEQFTGLSSIGMSALALSLIGTVMLTVEGLTAILNAVKPSQVRSTRGPNNRYMLGHYLSDYKAHLASSGGIGGAVDSFARLDVAALLGIMPTTRPFGQALRKGARAFFGMENGLDANKIVGLDTGYNVTVARSLVRSGQKIVDSIGSMGGNPVEIFKQAIDIIDVIKSSRIIGACNIFAQLGDSLLIAEDSLAGSGDLLHTGGAIKRPNYEIELDRTERPGHLKDKMTLKWANRRAPALMLLPSTLVSAYTVLPMIDSTEHNRTTPLISDLVDADDTTKYVTVDTYSKTNVASTPRIPSDKVAEFEKSLDATYVPFYFHDLRTNEIISFHAFLDDLKDSYSPQYEDATGYGRIDSVKIYKSTGRKVTFGFYAVATSEHDFTIMWSKINKLVTLVYPQFTRGKEISIDKYRFTKPFSQQIGASPLIRLRIGDVIRSNYSDFDLARLFGLGNASFQVDGVSQGPTDLNDNYVNTKKEKALQGQNQDVKFYPVAGRFMYEPTTSIFGSDTNYAKEFDTTKVGNNASIFLITVIDTNSDGTVQGRVDANPKYADQPELVNRYNNPKSTDYVVGGVYRFHTNQLRITPDSEKTLKRQGIAYKASGDADMKKIAEFFSPQNNAVVKSFKDMGGKGLPGTLDNLEFAFLDEKYSWSTEQGQQAPMIVKINTGLSVVHDIQPGLDHFGYNRAPTYQIASAKKA